MTIAMQPATYYKLVLSKGDVQGDALGDDQFEHGNEDQPGAHRGLSVNEKDISCNIVMLRVLDVASSFQVVHALLFEF